jgi:hypothetical protein
MEALGQLLWTGYVDRPQRDAIIGSANLHKRDEDLGSIHGDKSTDFTVLKVTLLSVGRLRIKDKEVDTTTAAHENSLMR